MEELKINETPVRTSRNFNINNIKLKSIKIPEKINSFANTNIIGQTSKIKVEELKSNLNLNYGLGEILTNQVNKNSNQDLRITIDSKTNKEMIIEFKFDKLNNTLVDNIEILAKEDSKSTIILKYLSNDTIEYFHNGAIRLFAEKNSNINIIIVNLLNDNSNNFISFQNELYENSNIKYTIADFGGKNSISNYYSNLKGDLSNNSIDAIYLGTNDQLFDLNYIAELRGKKTNVNIEVQGALKDNAKKHFKGTIDFKKGSKKSKGNENESCMLLSNNTKSLALPMLLCSEEDVEGNHSSSSGKIGEKELFYIMSRGFSQKEAMKLMVRAKFNKILENIKNQEIKAEIINEIDQKLS